jgi:hypothetical protein
VNRTPGLFDVNEALQPLSYEPVMVPNEGDDPPSPGCRPGVLAVLLIGHEKGRRSAGLSYSIHELLQGVYSRS